MPPKRSSKASKQSAIAFYPTLNKPATAVGKYISAPGKFWNGCPAADKEKRFKCAVVEFSRRCTITATASRELQLTRARNLSDDEEATPAEAADFDTVTDEAARWAALEKHVIREYRDDAGIVNEFALMYHLRNSFPLHYIAFKQTASHIPHEGNSEQLFSRSGALSDDNGKMDPARLAVWTSIGVNYSIYKPTAEQILERYLLKFSKGGKATADKLHEHDLGLLDPVHEDGEGYVVQAGSN